MSLRCDAAIEPTLIEFELLRAMSAKGKKQASKSTSGRITQDGRLICVQEIEFTLQQESLQPGIRAYSNTIGRRVRH